MNRIRRQQVAAGLVALFSLSAQAQGWQVPKHSSGLMPNPVVGKTQFSHSTARAVTVPP